MLCVSSIFCSLHMLFSDHGDMRIFDKGLYKALLDDASLGHRKCEMPVTILSLTQSSAIHTPNYSSMTYETIQSHTRTNVDMLFVLSSREQVVSRVEIPAKSFIFLQNN